MKSLTWPDWDDLYNTGKPARRVSGGPKAAEQLKKRGAPPDAVDAAKDPKWKVWRTGGEFGGYDDESAGTTYESGKFQGFMGFCASTHEAFAVRYLRDKLDHPIGWEERWGKWDPQADVMSTGCRSGGLLELYNEWGYQEIDIASWDGIVVCGKQAYIPDAD